MKTIRVVAAVICKKNKILATQRGYGEFKGNWEFPGGKIEPGESPQEALKREIREELSSDIHVGQIIETVEYDYPSFHLSMDCFFCQLTNDCITLNEASAAKWLTPEALDSVAWLPADLIVLEKVKQLLAI